jgi:hypothetical protein
MNLDDRTVQTRRFNRDADKFLAPQLCKQRIEHAGPPPAIHARIDRMPVTKSLWQRSSLAAALGYREDCIDHVEILVRDMAALTTQVLLTRASCST